MNARKDDGVRTAWTKFIDEVPLETREIPQRLLDLDAKSRSNLLPWNGQFSPQLVEALLTKYASRDSVVLDPFAGSGTVLCECGRQRISGVASEINPAAFALGSLYLLINASEAKRTSAIQHVDAAVQSLTQRSLPLLSRGCSGTVGHDDLLALRDRVASDHIAQSVVDGLLVRLDVRGELVEIPRVAKIWAQLRERLLQLPASSAPLRSFNADARALPIEDSGTNLVITSPPYINVFNYHQQYRQSAEALGWNILQVARSEIGSNRKHRQNRFLTVTQYCIDVAQAFCEIGRVSSRRARAVVVVGRESLVRGTPFFNGLIVARIGAAVGFDLLLRQERKFTNRFGQAIFEDILHFAPRKCRIGPVDAGRTVAEWALTESESEVPREAAADFEAARERIGAVEPSPLFRPETARAGSTLRLAS